jgi:F0F1-type ATP synthase assembly protein I
MKGQAISFIYVMNIIAQSIFSLLFNVAVYFGIGYLLNSVFGVDTWVYIPLILVGFILGIVSMIRFIISAMAGVERLENERNGKK